MDGMPLLHLKRQRDDEDYPGWVEWFKAFGHRETGNDRGIRYPNARLALEAVRENVGFLVCGLSLMLRDLEEKTMVHPFPISQNIVAPFPYRLRISAHAENRPQIQRFVDWLELKSRDTQREIDALLNQ
jgi:LysR family glycine cleavage system transcriptional activator